MDIIEQAKADFLRGIGYTENDAGWTQKDLDGKRFALEEAYAYEIEQFLPFAAKAEGK